MKKNILFALGIVLLAVVLAGIFYFVQAKEQRIIRENSAKDIQMKRQAFAETVKTYDFGFSDLKNLTEDVVAKKAGARWNGLAPKEYVNDQYLFGIKLPMAYDVDETLDASGYTLVPNGDKDVLMGVYFNKKPGLDLRSYVDAYFEDLGSVEVKGVEDFSFGTFKDAKAYWVVADGKVGLYVFRKADKDLYYNAFVMGSPEKLTAYRYIFAYMLQTFRLADNKDLSSDRV